MSLLRDTMSRGELPLLGDEPRSFTKGLKRTGTNQEVATSHLGVHTYMPCMLVAGLARQSKDWGVKSVRVNSAFHLSGVGTGAGGTLGLPGGNSQALPRALNLAAIAAGQGETTVELW